MPTFAMQAVVDSNDPLNGKVGAVSMTQVTFWNADPSGVVVTETSARAHAARGQCGAPEPPELELVAGGVTVWLPVLTRL
jgi:hypothetical protein